MKNDLSLHIPANARWHDILSTESKSSSISFKNNRLHGINEKENSGMGIRLNIDGKTGFSYTNDPDRLAEVTGRAAELAAFGDPEGYELPEKAQVTFEPYDEAINSCSTAAEIEKGHEMIALLTDRYPGIHADLNISVSSGKTRLENSRGLAGEYRNSYYGFSISATYIPREGSKIDVWDSLSAPSSRNFSHLASVLIEKIEKAQTAVPSESGRLPVIVTPRAFGRLLGIVASGLDARAVFKGISPFKDKMGEKLFHDSFTISDNPLLKDSPFSFPFDDEGVMARNKDLISGGMLQNFVTDLKHAERLGIEALGNASRGYASLPAPSFSNITVPGGTIPYKELLKEAPRAVLIESFIGLGQSNTLTGEFSANLDLAYLVENGEISGRVKDCMVKGNLFELLKDNIIFSQEREQVGSSLLPALFFPAIDYTA